MSGTATAPPVLLSVDGLRVRYSGMVALDGVSLDVRQGEIFGLIGPNGAGKTTLIEAISGFLPDAEGDITFNGSALRGMRPDQRVARGLGRTFQSLELFEDLTVRENLYVAHVRPAWWRGLVDLVRWSRWPASARKAVDDALELLGITQYGDDLPSQLPNGVRKLVAVARAVAGDARLLLLDEPAAGLETNESLDLGQRLRVLASAGTSLLLVDHDMGLVLSVCDRVHVLDFGKTIAEGTPEEIRASSAVVAAYVGTDSDDGPDSAGPDSAGPERQEGGSQTARFPGGTTLRERAVFHKELGRAWSRIRAARAVHREAISSAWAATLTGADVPARLLTDAATASVYTVETCADVVADLFRYGGARALSLTSSLQRHLRDALAARQHVSVSEEHYETAGRELLQSRKAAESLE